MVQSGDYSSNRAAASQAGDLTSLYVGYALILFAGPTFGVAGGSRACGGGPSRAPAG